MGNIFTCPKCQAHEAQIKYLQGLVDQLLHQIAPKSPEPEKIEKDAKVIAEVEGETIDDRDLKSSNLFQKEVYGAG